MLNRIFFNGWPILAATIVPTLSACVMGVPIVSPVDILLVGAGGGSEEPLDWPFETNLQSLELECGAERIAIVVSPIKALVTLSDSTGKLDRDFSRSSKLRYYRMTPVTEGEHELIVTEGGPDEFKIDWLVLHLEGTADLKYEHISKSCRVERQ